METSPPSSSSIYPHHQVIPAENIMIQPSTPPSAAYSLMLQHSMPSMSSHQQQPSSSSRVLSKKMISTSQPMHSYRLKYMSLKKKCSGIQLGNEKLLNRLYHVKKAVRKLTRERRFLMSKLDEFGDDYKSSQLPVPIEDESMLSLITTTSMPSTYSPPKEPSTSGTKRSASPMVTGDKSNGIKPSLVKTPSVSPAGVKRRRSSQAKSDKEKDPNAPKKPANAFLMFCQQERLPVLAEFNRDNPGCADMSHQELTKELAKKWNDLTDDQKKIYYTMYDQDKRRYEHEMRQYKLSIGKTLKTPRRSTTPSVTRKTLTPSATISQASSATIAQTLAATIAQASSATVAQSQSATMAQSSSIMQPTVISQVTTNPVTTAPSSVQPPPSSMIFKQEQLNNNNTAVAATIGANQLAQAVTTASRSMPLTTISLTKPPQTSATNPQFVATSHAVTSAMIPGTTSHALTSAMIPGTTSNAVTSAMIPGTTSHAVTSAMIPGTTSYIKLSFTPATLQSSTMLTDTTAVNVATVPIAMATTFDGRTSFVAKSSAQGTVISQPRGQTTMSSISSRPVVMPVKSSGQNDTSVFGGKATASIRIGGPTTISNRIGGRTLTASIGGSTMVGKTTSSGIVRQSTAVKIGGQASKSRIGAQNTASKISGQVVTSKLVGLPTTSRIGSQPVTSRIGLQTATSKMGGQIMTSKIGLQTATYKIGSQPATSRIGGQTATSRIGGHMAISKISSQTATSRIGGQLATSKFGGQTATSKIGGQATFKIGGHTSTSKIGGQTATFKIGGQKTATSKIGGQTATSRISGQTATSKIVGQTATSRISGQTATSKIVGQTATSRIGGQTATSRIGGLNATSKIGSQSNISRIGGQSTTSRIGGQQIATSKIGGKTAIFKSGGQTATSRIGGQAAIVSKSVGQTNLTSGLVGRGISMGGQGISAAAVLSRLASSGGGGRITGAGLTNSTTASSRVTATGPSTHTSVVKETPKRILTAQKPAVVKKTEPLSKAEDPYHFDD